MGNVVKGRQYGVYNDSLMPQSQMVSTKPTLDLDSDRSHDHCFNHRDEVNSTAGRGMLYARTRAIITC